MLSLGLALVLHALGVEDAHEFTTHNRIVYSKVGDRKLLLDAFVPDKPGKYPAVLVVHGGAWRSGNRFQLRNYANALTKRGYVCFAIDYRLAPKHKWPAQIQDCRAAVKWVRRNAAKYKVDATRLGAVGYSAGGHLVSLLGTTGEAPNRNNGNIDTRLQAVVAGGAPTDFRNMPDKGRWARYWMGGDATEFPKRFHEASSAAFVTRDDPPMFFFNGTKDRLVGLDWTKPMHEAIKAKGIRTEMHLVRGAGHLATAVNPAALKAAWAFFDKELKGRRTPTPAPSSRQDKNGAGVSAGDTGAAQKSPGKEAG